MHRRTLRSVCRVLTRRTPRLAGVGISAAILLAGPTSLPAVDSVDGTLRGPRTQQETSSAVTPARLSDSRVVQAQPAQKTPPAKGAPPTAAQPSGGAAGNASQSGGTPTAQASLDDVINKLEGAYGKINDLKAEFSQNAFNKSLNQSIPASGVVFLKKGGKLRWEYAQPTPQQIVSDGKTLWVYTPSLNQVNVAPAPEALAGPAGSFLVGLGKLREHFGVRFLNPVQPRDGDGNYVLDLDPRQPLPTLSRLILSIDPKAWEVRKAVVYDQFENTVTMRFTKMALNSGLADSLFTFTPPKGVATVPMQ